ncbi:TIGR00266 family protein, partial [Phascolarctobacterium faecium]
TGNTLCITSGGFLAAEESVKIETKMQNLGKGLFSGAGLFVVKASGTGTLFFNSFGAIYPLELQVGEEMVVDTGHLVAWDADMNYKVTKASSGIMSSLTSGEMLVCKFTGPGKVYTQSRNPGSFGCWVGGIIPSQG